MSVISVVFGHTDRTMFTCSPLVKCKMAVLRKFHSIKNEIVGK